MLVSMNSYNVNTNGFFIYFAKRNLFAKTNI